MSRSLICKVTFSAMLALACAPALACVYGKVPQPNSTFPLRSGTLFYHSYNSYGDGTSHLFQYDFSSRAKTQIDKPTWGVSDPMNAFPHPDHSSIAFMGVQGGNWNVFLHKLGSSTAPLNVTATALGGRNEDPKFSPDGTLLAIKHEGDIYVGNVQVDGNDNLSISSWRAVTNDGYANEESMPYFSADSEYLFYAQGAGANSRIYRIGVDGSGKTQWQVPPAGQKDYYPVARIGGSNLLFTRVQSSGVDQLAQSSGIRSQRPATIVSLNECTANNSDAATTRGSYIVFSSTGYNFGSYGLMVGDISNGKVWKLPVASVNVNDGTNKLGASYAP